MIFTFTSWDADLTEIKYVVARCSTSIGIKAEFLVRRIREIITTLYLYGLMVNNICGDGESENRSCFKQLATMIARDVSGSRCSQCTSNARNCICPSLLDNFPNDGLLIIFHHPCGKEIKVSIGGEMPHLVETIVKRLESSFGSKSKVTLEFRGEAMSLKMIKKSMAVG